MKHYSEADLLETYYTQPGESMPAMMHLAECGECAARYESLERKLRGMAACHDEPEAFWARQRASIMGTIERRQARPLSWTRVAAAAALIVALGSVAVFRDQPAPPAAATGTIASTAATKTDNTTEALDPLPADPWESEALSDFQSVVAWESWVENGDQSL